MDIPNDSAEQIYHLVLNSPLPDIPIKEIIYYYSSSHFSLSPSGKSSAVAVKKAKILREAKIKYDMTQIKVTTRPIKDSSKNVEISTISEIEEFMESAKQYELRRQEFVGEPYYTEFKAEEERKFAEKQRESLIGQQLAMFGGFQEIVRQQTAMFSGIRLAQEVVDRYTQSIRLAQEVADTYKRPIRLAQEVAMLSRPQETIRQQLAMLSRSQESINLALNSSLRSVQQVANIRTDFLRDVRRAANIKANFLRDVQQVANIRTDFLRDVRRAANIKADFLRDVRRAANIKF